MASPSLVWFRDDLRLADHPALRAALDRDEPIVCVYVLDEESASRSFGNASPTGGRDSSSVAERPVA